MLPKMRYRKAIEKGADKKLEDEGLLGSSNSTEVSLSMPEAPSPAEYADIDEASPSYSGKGFFWKCQSLLCSKKRVSIWILVIGSLVSILVGYFFFSFNKNELVEENKELLNQWENTLKQIFSTYSVALYGVSAYASGANGKVTGEGFRLHTTRMFELLEENKPTNFGYFKFVNISDKEQYENETAAYHFSRLGPPKVGNDTIWNATIYRPEDMTKTDYYDQLCNYTEECFVPIQFKEPLESSKGAINFDVLRRVFRQKDLIVAREDGILLTPAFELIQDDQKDDRISYSTALIMPVAGTLDFVDAIIHFDTVLTESFKSSLSGKTESFLYQYLDFKDSNFYIGGLLTENGKQEFIWPGIAYEDLDSLDSDFVGEREVIWAGKKFVIHMRTFYEEADAYNAALITTILIAVFGSLVSIILAVVIIKQQQHVAETSKQMVRLENKNIIAAERARADAEKSLNDFLAHEVRNPLSVAFAALNFISSNLKVELANSHKEIQEGIFHDLNLINYSLQFIHELVNNVLDLNKITEGSTLTLVEKPTNLRDDVLQAVKDLLFKHSSAVMIEVQCPKDLYINCDALRLKQILLNLGKNATKFVDRGFIRFTAVMKSRKELILTVDDSGPGIPDSIRDNLFKKYQYVGDKLRQGTGIGLSLCKALVEAMNGTISLNEDYDSGFSGQRGTSFVISLPRSALTKQQLADLDILQGLSSPKSESESDYMHVYIGRPLRFLVIEDEARIRLILKRKLERICCEFELVEASCGESALTIIDNHNKGIRNTDSLPDIGGFDYIICDQNMPGSSSSLPYTGEETLRFLLSNRNLPENLSQDEDPDEFLEEKEESIEESAHFVPNMRNTKIIGCSGDDMESKFKSVGADLFWRKPLPDVDQMQDALVKLLPFPKSCNVLIMDDEKINQIIVQRIVKKFAPVEWTYTTVDNPKDALHEISTKKYDILFLDEHMSEMGPDAMLGSDIARFARTNIASQAQHSIILHVSGDISTIEQVKDPRTLVVGKPLPNPKALSGLIKRAMYLKEDDESISY